jgi:beta-mannosidase
MSSQTAAAITGLTAKLLSGPGDKCTLPLEANWNFREAGSTDWLPAHVPGCVHTDLLRHRLIPDPFWAANEKELQWIEEKDWQYVCTFEADSALFRHEFLDLVVEGLDTLALVFLNEQEVGRSENMFIGYRFNLKEALRPGTNILEVRFASPMNYIRSRQSPDDYHESNDPVGGSSHLRKEQCSFGWDWGPRFATCGIYKPIRIEAWSCDRIESVKITQLHTANGVELNFEPRHATKKAAEIRGTVSLNGYVVAELSGLQCRIPDPQLWWPNGQGRQPLYTVKIELGCEGRVVDVWQGRIGLRTIELDRHPDEFGESFQFVVNGRPIFAKGASWIPAHSFVTEAGKSTYENLLSSATAAHMNMIRVWGGGIYERDAFYDLCDEKGLLIWQDFMFSCALYPGDDAFLASVKAEAEHQIPRLAHRPCLALWCGNNEIEQMPKQILKTPERKQAYEDVFYRVLPEAVAKFDGVTPYRPSSPHNPAGYDKGHNNELAGDAHFWDVWHERFPVKRYEETKFRFCSEFGMQSYSSPEIAATFCPPDRFNVFGPEMENHQKNRAGNLIILDYISRLYRFPKDYAALAYLSQLNQAYCMKFGVEHFRRCMPRTMGALYWQLNDCWPVFSWSSIEFGGRWKALHYAARRFFSPALVSARIIGDEISDIGNTVRSTVREAQIYTVYDAPEKTTGNLRWFLCLLDGSIVESGEENVELAPGESRLRKSLDLSGPLAARGARQLYLRLKLETENGLTSEDTVFLTAPRFIEFSRAPISTSIRHLSGHEFELTFFSPGFHHRVQFEIKGVPIQTEENFFDLFPNEARAVRIAIPEAIAEAELERSLTVRSLVDSY